MSITTKTDFTDEKKGLKNYPGKTYLFHLANKEHRKILLFLSHKQKKENNLDQTFSHFPLKASVESVTLYPNN